MTYALVAYLWAILPSVCHQDRVASRRGSSRRCTAAVSICRMETMILRSSAAGG